MFIGKWESLEGRSRGCRGLIITLLSELETMGTWWGGGGVGDKAVKEAGERVEEKLFPVVYSYKYDTHTIREKHKPPVYQRI